MQPLMSEAEVNMKKIYSKIVNFVMNPPKNIEAMKKSLTETDNLMEEFTSLETNNLVERARKRNYYTKLLRLRSLLNHRGQQYERAEFFYKKAIAEQKKRKYPHHDELCLLHFNLAKMYRQTGEYFKCETAGLGVIENFPKILGNSIGDVGTSSKNSIRAQSLTLVAHSCVQQGRHALAGDYFKRADVVFRKLGDLPEKNSFYLDYSDYLRRNGKNEDAKRLLKKHTGLFEKKYGEVLESFLLRGGQMKGMGGPGMGGMLDGMGLGQFGSGGVLAHFNHSLYPSLAYMYFDWGNYSFYLHEDALAKKYWKKSHELLRKSGDKNYMKIKYYFQKFAQLFILDEDKNERVIQYEFGGLSSRDFKDILNRQGVGYDKNEDLESLKSKVKKIVTEKFIPNECSCCGKESEKLLRCSRCRIAVYCTRECQVKDWKKHKGSCNKL